VRGNREISNVFLFFVFFTKCAGLVYGIYTQLYVGCIELYVGYIELYAGYIELFAGYTEVYVGYTQLYVGYMNSIWDI